MSLLSSVPPSAYISLRLKAKSVYNRQGCPLSALCSPWPLRPSHHFPPGSAHSSLAGLLAGPQTGQSYSQCICTSCSLRLGSFLSNPWGCLPYFLQICSDISFLETTSLIILYENIECLFKITYCHPLYQMSTNFSVKGHIVNIF